MGRLLVSVCFVGWGQGLSYVGEFRDCGCAGGRGGIDDCRDEEEEDG